MIQQVQLLAHGLGAVPKMVMIVKGIDTGSTNLEWYIM